MIAIAGRRALLPLAAGSIAVAGVFAAVLAEDALPGDDMLAANAIDLSPLDRVPAAAWDALATKRVYFGHQSVGYDLIAGIEDIRRRKPEVRLGIVETDDPSKIPAGTLAHARVGKNGDPGSKIAEFERRMVSAGPDGIDIAFVKLCYADVLASTPAEELFGTYEKSLERLEAALPRTRFVRVTVPLTARQTGLKARLKRLAGRGADWDADNRARKAFNGLVRSACGAKRPLLDIAAAESKLPDGTAVEFRSEGDRVPCLARCYTTDGGHLNEAGRLVAARDTLLVLAELVR